MHGTDLLNLDCDAVVVGVAGYSVSCILAFLSLLGGTTLYRLLIVMGLCISTYGLVMFVTERALIDQETEQEEDVQLEVSMKN